jgi:hypothetical protein
MLVLKLIVTEIKLLQQTEFVMLHSL